MELDLFLAIFPLKNVTITVKTHFVVNEALFFMM